MMRHFCLFAFLGLLVVSLACPSARGADEPATDEQKYRTALEQVRPAIQKAMQEQGFTTFSKGLEELLDRHYRKRETPFDSEAGRAFLAEQLASSSALTPTSPAEPALVLGSSTPGPDADLFDGLTNTGEPPVSNTGPARPAASAAQFRESVTSFDDVQALVIRQLYEDAEKTGVTVGSGKLRGLHPVYFYAVYRGTAQGKAPNDIVETVGAFFTADPVKDQFASLVAAYDSKLEDPKRAQSFLDAYLGFRKATQDPAKRKVVVETALRFSEELAKRYYAGSTGQTGRSTASLQFTLWANQSAILTEASKSAAADTSAAANVYAWLADAMVVLDSKRRRQAEQGNSDGPAEPGTLTAEEYRQGLQNLDGAVAGVRQRQGQLADLLRRYQATSNDNEKSALQKQILDMYCGNRSDQRSLPERLAQIESSPQTVALYRGLPENADPATKSQYERLFGKTSSILRARQTQKTIDQMMVSNGFGDAVDEAQAAALQRRQQNQARRGKAEGSSTEREGGGFAQGMNGFMGPLSQQAGPITDAIMRANQQQAEAERQQRMLAGQQAAQQFDQDRLNRLKTEEQLAREQDAAINDRNQNTVEGASTVIDQQRELERRQNEAYDQQQREIAARRQKAEQEAAAQAAAQARTQAANQQGSNGPAAPTNSTGTNVAAPSGSTALPGGGGTATGTGTGAGTGSASGGTPVKAELTDSQIAELARSKVALVPNSWGIEPMVLSDAEIKGVLEPLISARVAQFNQELSAKQITVNADLQYSGPGIQTTGLPSGHDRYAMWMNRFPEMRGAAMQAAQQRFAQLQQDQIRTLMAARNAQRQAAAQQQQTQGPVAVTEPPRNPAPAAPQTSTPSTRSTVVQSAPAASSARESTEVVQARKVIQSFDKAAKGASGITPTAFLQARSSYNAAQPYDLDISLKSLVQLVNGGWVTSKVPAPAIEEDLGEEGEQAQRVIDEFDQRAGGKSGITPKDFLQARNYFNATNPYKIEINLPGLIRLVNLGMVNSRVKAPTAKAQTDPAAPSSSSNELEPDDASLKE